MPPVYTQYSQEHEIVIGARHRNNRPTYVMKRGYVADSREETSYSSGSHQRSSSKKPTRTPNTDQRLEERSRKVSLKHTSANKSGGNGLAPNQLSGALLRKQSSVGSPDEASSFFSSVEEYQKAHDPPCQEKMESRTSVNVKEYQKSPNPPFQEKMETPTSVNVKEYQKSPNPPFQQKMESSNSVNVKAYQKSANPPSQEKMESSDSVNNGLLYQQRPAQNDRMEPELSTMRSCYSPRNGNTGSYQEVPQNGLKNAPLTASPVRVLPSESPSRQFRSPTPMECTAESPRRPVQPFSNGRADSSQLMDQYDIILPNTKPSPNPYQTLQTFTPVTPRAVCETRDRPGSADLVSEFKRSLTPVTTRDVCETKDRPSSVDMLPEAKRTSTPVTVGDVCETRDRSGSIDRVLEAKRTSTPVTVDRPGSADMLPEAKRISTPVTLRDVLETKDRPGSANLLLDVKRSSTPITADRPGIVDMLSEAKRTSTPVTVDRPGSVNMLSEANRISSPLPARNFWEIKDHAAMVPESKTKTVVIDVSSYFVRAGLLRNQPKPAEICFPTVTSFRTDFSGTAVGDKVYENLFSETASQQQMIFPLRQRKIGEETANENTAIETSILQEVFTRLRVNPAEYKVLLTLPTRASALRPNFLTALYNQFHVPAVAIMSGFRASLQTAKSSTCLLINLGCDLEILPVYQGSLFEGGRFLLGQFGENIANMMLANLIEAGMFTTREENVLFSQYIFQRAAFVDNELMPCEDIDINMSEFGGEPNKTFHISAELRKSSTEGMFRPCMTKNFEPNAPSLPRLLRQCLQACPIESRQALCANVLLVGEYAGIEGLQQRLQSEIQQFLPKNTILSVKTVPNSAEAAYSGACLTSALLQGPRAPQCQWFKFMEPAMWDSIKASAPGGLRLVDRLNAQMCWP